MISQKKALIVISHFFVFCSQTGKISQSSAREYLPVGCAVDVFRLRVHQCSR